MRLAVGRPTSLAFFSGCAADPATSIYHALGVSLDTRLGKDGGTRPITTGQPIKELFS